jgi:hypothetical protein
MQLLSYRKNEIHLIITVVRNRDYVSVSAKLFCNLDWNTVIRKQTAEGTEQRTSTQRHLALVKVTA